MQIRLYACYLNQNQDTEHLFHPRKLPASFVTPAPCRQVALLESVAEGSSCLLTSLLSRGSCSGAPPHPARPPPFCAGAAPVSTGMSLGVAVGQCCVAAAPFSGVWILRSAFICSLMDGHFGCSCCLAVVDEAATHNPVCISLWTYTVLSSGCSWKKT